MKAPSEKPGSKPHGAHWSAAHRSARTMEGQPGEALHSGAPLRGLSHIPKTCKPGVVAHCDLEARAWRPAWAT